MNRMITGLVVGIPAVVALIFISVWLLIGDDPPPSSPVPAAPNAPTATQQGAVAASAPSGTPFQTAEARVQQTPPVNGGGRQANSSLSTESPNGTIQSSSTQQPAIATLTPQAPAGPTPGPLAVPMSASEAASRLGIPANRVAPLGSPGYRGFKILSGPTLSAKLEPYLCIDYDPANQNILTGSIEWSIQIRGSDGIFGRSRVGSGFASYQGPSATVWWSFECNQDR